MKLQKAYNFKNNSSSKSGFTHAKAGFTLIEIVVMLGLFAIIATFGLAIGTDTYRRTIFDSERTAIVSLLQKARNQSMNNINEKEHGVFIDADNGYILFEGNSYVPGNPQNQEVPKSKVTQITTGDAEVVFKQLSGEVLSPTTITLKDGLKEGDITINAAGGIVW